MAGRDGQDTEANGLLVKAAGGDRTAFVLLYDLVAPRVYGVVLRVLRSPAMAEEVTRQIHVEVWRRAEQFDPELGSAVAWIIALAHRRAVDAVRSAAGRRAWEERVAEALAGEGDLVAVGVDLRAEDERLGKALSYLTDLQRQAIQLTYYDGYTYREVAHLLDTSDGTIKTRLSAAVRRLRTLAAGQ